jgi:hypothetical protein
MCTVTYLPLEAGFILTHNRDEAPARSPQHISSVQIAGSTLLFPRDTKAGGTWIIAARDGRTACLLNGAFVKHQHQPPYRRSRGLLLLDFFEWPDSEHFFAQYDLDNIEPFTLLVFQSGRVTEFRWDGTSRHRIDLPPEQPHFWCSATLYPAPVQALREQVFRNWLESHHRLPDGPRSMSSARRLPSSIFKLHLTGSVGDPENDYVMNRSGRVCTVSVTQVVQQNGAIRMRYFDLLEGKQNIRRSRMASLKTVC